MKKRSAAILVLGDLNRSPRMLNHCKAISQNMDEINEISLIGFQGGDLRSDIEMDRKIKVYLIPQMINNYIKRLPRFLFILSALIRIIIQIFSLFYILLFKIPRPDFLILQNPPGIPAMYICSIICFLRRSTFIIDWHNYGYTILEVNNRSKFIVKIAKLYEWFYSKSAHLNFCVSDAMKTHLKSNFGVKAITLPDRAIKYVFTGNLCLREKHELFNKYEELKNILTIEDENRVIGYKNNRPILMLSSTSWTPDEDFDLLLDSFILTEHNLLKKFELNELRKVLFLITGKGPQKEKFLKRLSEHNLQIFKVKTIWLDSDDYPKLLGSAEMGVCLHYSSSGFDLPMKVVDMFAAQLPVAAFYYDTILELVKPNHNGFLFKNEEELTRIFEKVIVDISENGICEELEKFKSNLKEFGSYDWVSQWMDIAYAPIVTKTKLKLRKE